MTNQSRNIPQWFVLRDLKRSNARDRAYSVLAEKGLNVFTPLRTRIVTSCGRTRRLVSPVIPDLLFVRDTRAVLDPIVGEIPTLQYRYARGAGYCQPMTVPEDDMDRFMLAVRSSENVRYYTPDEVTPQMFGREVSIVGGPLDGYSGRLLKVRGNREKRLIVELTGYLYAAPEVCPDFIRIEEN
ncbi:MAG: UpxY family transcription antiterminator [Candidatus Cryptobacteroides sp.]